MSRSEYLCQWRKKNPEKTRQHKRNYYSIHKEHEQEKSNQRYFKSNNKKFYLKQHFCVECWDFVYWDHDHFITPKRIRYSREPLPEYKEEYERKQEKFMESVIDLYAYLREKSAL